MARLLIAVLFFVGLATALPVSACSYVFIYLFIFIQLVLSHFNLFKKIPLSGASCRFKTSLA